MNRSQNFGPRLRTALSSISVRFIALFIVSVALHLYGANGTAYYFDVDGTTGGFGSPTGTYNIKTAANWSTSSAGTAATAILPTGSNPQMTFGNSGTDFTGAAFAINLDNDAYPWTPWGGLRINSSSATITLNGTQNDYLSGDQTWTVAGGSTFNEAASWTTGTGAAGLNFNGMNVTLTSIGSGNATINFNTMVGLNNNSRIITQNGSNLVVNLNSPGGGTQGTDQQAGYTLTNGTLNFHVNNALNRMRSADGAKLTLNGGVIDNTSGSAMTLDLYQGTYVISNSFTFTGTNDLNFGTFAVALTTATPTITVGNNTLTIGGVVSGGFGLTKSGAGTMTLSGANTYSGGTNVTAGNLFVTNTSGSGTGSGPVAVTNGVLGGTGTISGAVSISSTGSLAPGIGAPGKLTINNSVTFASGTTFAVDINGTTAGASYDQLATNSAVTLGNATLAVMLGAAPVGQQVYTIISGASSISGTFNGLAQGATVSYSYSGTPYMFIVSYTGGTGHDVTLTACSGSTPVITTQPSNAQVFSSDTATFTVAAGTGVSYQWQRGVYSGGIWNWSNVTGGVGGTSATYKLQTSIILDSNTEFRCIVAACGSVTSNAALLLVCNRTVITTPPANATGVNVGDSATFTIAATGSGVTYQWQKSLDNGTSWPAITGQTSTTCRARIDTVDVSSQYRCTVTGAVACGSSIVNSNAVTVQVCFPPVITTQPISQGIVNGQNVTFSVAASGKGALTYQWQRQEIGSSTWGDISGQTATSYSKIAAPSDSGAKFRCVVSASPCGSTPSSSAMITSCSLPVVTDPAPIAPIVVIGDTVRFSVSATNALGYQWQRSTTKGASWANVPGATLLEYKFAVAASDTVQVRCIVSGGCSGFDTSAAATLTPCFAVGITTQPASQTITAGANATFSVVAVGTSLTYQWQRQENGASTWAPIALANTASYVLPATIPSTGNVSADSGAQFRCVVTSTCGGTVTSGAAIANVNTTPIIIKNPSDTSVTVGNMAVFSVQARGTITSYQWQKTINSGTSWSNVTVGTGGTSAVYSFTTTISDTVTGVQFRCVVTGPSGSTTSGIGRIGLCFPVAILTNPQSDTVTSGDQATFSVTATGTGLNYQWQKDTAGTGAWVAISSATNANYGFNVTAANNNWRFRCLVAGSCGTPATSGVAALSVCSPIALSANPKDTIVSLGANAIFSVTATGTSPAYQWQRSRNSGTTWTNVTGAGATTASCTVPVDTADTGALFHCVVTGGCGTATSGPAKLTVCFPLAIPAAGQPVNQTNISPGLQAIFHVRPTGLRLSYQWQRSADGTTWSPITGATGNDFSLIVSAFDNNAKFRCWVGEVTCDSIISNSATLTVCAAPEVTLQPDSPRVIVKQPAQFIITATGTGLTYQWQRMDSGSSVWNSISGATYTAYTIDSTKITDNNARFRCKVKGQCDSTISNDARLSVFVKAKAMFSMTVDGKPDSIAPAPVTVRLTDSSSGSISMWIWSYGDGKRDTNLSAGTIKDHQYDSVKVYTIKLIVQGPGGIDSVSRNLTVYSKTGNPIMMTGRYIPADSSVMLVYKNFGSLNAAPAAPPTVDSIKLWFQLGSLPDTVGGAKFLKSYSLAELKAKGSVDSDKVKIDMSGSSFSTCGFMTQIVWNDGRKTLFDSLNGFVVVMRDTLRPRNNLALSGAYAPWDTVTFYLGSVQTIDSASDSIGLWYGIGPDSVPEFVNSTNPDVHWWKKDSVIAAASNNRFEYTVQNSQFNTGTSDLTCAVVIRGRNKLFSDTLKTKVFIGRERPKNPIKLYAAKDTAASSIINLMWDRYTAADSVEKIRIYYRTGSAIDTGRYDFSGVQLYSLEVTPLNLDDRSRPVKNLDAKTRYYFGAQVYKKGMWSIVTAASCATDSTDTAGASTIRNTIRINPVVFDSATNLLHISWRLDTSGMSGLFVGYSYSTTSGNPQNTTVKTVGNGVTSDTGSMVLDLGDSLLFNQDYFVYLWLKKENQQWKAPTDSSTAAVHTPAFVWQAVHADFTLAGETSYWVNGQVRLVTPKVTINNVATMTATIQSFADTVTSLAGFINVGQSISLAQIKKQQDLEIGLKTTLSTGQKLNDVFIYRFDAANGKWLVDTSTKRDTNGYVSVLASELAMPFAALIDMQPPVATVTDTSTTPVNKHDAVNYTVEVSDNVGNLRWSFQSTQGGYPYARGNRVDKTLTNGIDTARVSIDTNLVGDENGVMARFITCDGRFSDTINLSRRVVRLKSDPTGTADTQWVPLRVTAVIDSPQAERLLRLVDTTAKTPQYDNRYLRLFRWHPDASNIAARDRWEEYSKAPDSLFGFISGRLMWIKTRKAVFFDFGRAVTMPQLVPLMIPLAAREYTDFAVPYHYNMRVGDIIAATRDSGAYADSLQIYSWSKGKNGSYSAQPFFIKNIQDSLGRLLPCAGDSIGFTVYNPSNVMRKLVVPPISEFMPAYKDTTAKAKTGPDAANSRWAIKVLPKTADGTVLTSVYCGYTAKRSEGKIFYPVAPSFGGIGVCVFDINSGMTYGHKIESDLSGGGCSYLLMFGNDSKSRQTISFTLERSGAFPSVMKTAAYNPLTGETVDIGAGGLSVPVDGEGREYRWLFAGTEQYIASAAREHTGAKLALTSVYPNPVRRFVHLLYTLPFGRVANVDFTVLDIMGRTIWHKSIKESSIAGGRRDYVWYGTASNGHRVAAGVYVLKMMASDAKGRSIGTFDRRLTVLP